MAVSHIPAGGRSVSPYLVVEDPRKMIEFIQQAFDAQLEHCMEIPGGGVMHAQLRIGDSVVMLGQVPPGSEASRATIHLYVPDADKLYQQALSAGATSVMELTDQFYGDRSAGVKDFAGNQWWISTHIEDVPADEIAQRAEEAMKKRG